MYFDLTGRKVLVTGGSRGIGRAIAVRLAEAGADVAINYLRKVSSAEKTADLIRATSREAMIIKANVANEQHLQSMFDQIESQFGKLDILISNAASGVLKPVMELTLHHWHWTMDINAGTLIPMSQHFRRVLPQGATGNIIAVSSLGAVRAIPNYTAVGASKAALESVVRHLAAELASENIHVNAVSAGIVETDALRHFPNRDELIKRSLEKTPAGRLTTPENVADTVLFLCSPLADMIHGQTIIVDGGYSILG